MIKITKKEPDYEIQEKQKKFCSIDGIEFNHPQSFEEYIWYGLVALFLLITLPVWIIPYIFGKIVVAGSHKKKVTYEYKQIICPSCGSDSVKGGEEKRVCTICGWHEEKKYFSYY